MVGEGGSSSQGRTSRHRWQLYRLLEVDDVEWVEWHVILIKIHLITIVLPFCRKNQLYGLTTIIIFVTKAFDIPIPKKDTAPSVKVVYGEESECKETFDTRTVTDYLGTDPLNHYSGCAFHVPVTAAMLQQKRSIFDWACGIALWKSTMMILSPDGKRDVHVVTFIFMSTWFDIIQNSATAHHSLLDQDY